MTRKWRETRKEREYADQLQRRRWELNLTTAEVAAATGICASVISKYENLRSRPGEANRERLERYYSSLEAERMAENSNNASERPALIQQTREIIRSAIDQMMELLVKLEELCSEPASEDAGADQKVRDEEWRG